ncbi:hypothetical protein ADUPG1_010772, partial [Aduncisulcus paluster]
PTVICSLPFIDDDWFRVCSLRGGTGLCLSVEVNGRVSVIDVVKGRKIAGWNGGRGAVTDIAPVMSRMQPTEGEEKEGEEKEQKEERVRDATSFKYGSDVFALVSLDRRLYLHDFSGELDDRDDMAEGELRHRGGIRRVELDMYPTCALCVLEEDDMPLDLLESSEGDEQGVGGADDLSAGADDDEIDVMDFGEDEESSQ